MCYALGMTQRRLVEDWYEGGFTLTVWSPDGGTILCQLEMAEATFKHGELMALGEWQADNTYELSIFGNGNFTAANRAFVATFTERHPLQFMLQGNGRTIKGVGYLGIDNQTWLFRPSGDLTFD